MEKIQETKLAVLKKIVSMRLDGKSDKEIDEKLKELFVNELHFGLCREIDEILCKRQHGGYWRSAYDFVETGEVIKRPRNSVLSGCEDDNSDVIGYVTESGFFTCNIEWHDLINDIVVIGD